jgi:N-carbamoylputrescine amidase
MKVASVQMKAVFADANANLVKAEKLAEEAFRSGAQWVILPEFFTSAMGFSPKMIHAVQPLDGPAMNMLQSMAQKYGGFIGGSYIAWKKSDCYNTFVLAAPDGTMHFHDKDLPTMWENCYYRGGSDDGVLATKPFKTGVALCWEFIRSQTARRLLDQIDLVIGGSCWWTLPKKPLPGFPRRLHDLNLSIMKETIPRFARMLGVPVIHAAHAGDLQGGLPLLPGFPYHSFFLGETQIVDGTGAILAHMSREDGEGFITADIDISRKQKPLEPIPERFWIPELPWQLRLIWVYQNWHGKRYYQRRFRQLAQKQGM